MQGTVGFLIFNDFEDMDLVGPYEMFGIWSQQFHGPKKIITISESSASVKSVHGLSLKADCSIAECPPLDCLVIPGGMGTRTEVNNDRLIAFIRDAAKNCQHVISVCTGAFLLQAADLLHHKKATTHWASIERLRAFKDVIVVEERYTRDENIWTSAGISAGTDLALAFIAAIAGDDVAGQVQLQAEYYPQQKIYGDKNQVLPAYTERSS